MTCRKCGELLSDNAKFCTNCGAKIEREESAAEVTVVNPVHEHYEDCVHEGHVGNPKSISFPEAVKLFFTRYNDFQGRSRRSEYWWVYLFNAIAAAVIGAILPDIAWIWSLVTLVPGIALGIRRMHDIGKSGWWLFISLVPLAGPIILLIYMCRDSGPDNQWGPNPKY